MSDKSDRNKRTAQAFVEDEWNDVETAWKTYVDRLVETPGAASYKQAREHIAGHRFVKAVPLLNQAIEEDPDYERLYFFRAQAYFYAGLAKKSLVDATKAIELFPEYHAARFLRGRARKLSGDDKGAFRDFRDCLRTPYHALAMKEIGQLKR